MNAKELIQEERGRQVEKEGWSAEHDDKHIRGELVDAGDSYFLSTNAGAKSPMPRFWPWQKETYMWKPSSVRAINLVKAGALYHAEKDRLRRLKNNNPAANVYADTEQMEINIGQVERELTTLLEKEAE